MKSRNRKLISLVLAASMIFTMNTAAFAGEIPGDDGDTAFVESAGTAEGTLEAAIEESADDRVTVDSTDGEMSAVGSYELESDGIYYRSEDPDDINSITTPITAITYVTDKTDKKSTEPNVATITKTTDPASWNNLYAEQLVNTVLWGNGKTDTYLNNSSPNVVSQDHSPENCHPVGYRSPAESSFSCRVIPIVKGQSYLFIGYELWGEISESKRLHVAGYDNLENSGTKHGIQEQDMDAIPVIEWDGRRIEYNKSGKHKHTRSKREILDVEASIVTYSNGTVTEVPGVEVGSVKIDKKALKAASVALDYSVVENKGVVAAQVGNKWEAKTRMEAWGNQTNQGDQIFVREYAAMGNTMPSFTLSVKLKGDEAKAYRKDVDKLLKDKDQRFYFGVQQSSIEMINYDILPSFYNSISCNEDPATGAKTYTISSENAERALGERLCDKAYDEGIDNKEEIFANSKLKISRFREKDGKATIKTIGNFWDGTLRTYGEEIATLKPGKDYNFVDGSIAGSKVKVLEFVKNGNFAYKPMDKKMVGKAGTDGKVTWTLSDDFNADNAEQSNLSQIGFKWAFRESPVNSKFVRYGYYMDTNVGFVYSRD